MSPMRPPLFILGILLSGCHMLQPAGTVPVQHPPSVMSMWDLYRYCQTSSDVEAVLTAAKELRQSADTHVVPTADLPKSFDRFVARQPVRTTVDPKAMAASCTLQAARTSLSAGRGRVAEQLLHSVVVSYPETEYTFYVEQAKVWIQELRRPGSDNPELHPISHR